MKVTVIGTGYVGLVTGACLASTGHNVTGLDVDTDKITALKRGICPIYEPGLEDNLVQGLKDGVLSFTSSPEGAFAGAELIFIAVGTPVNEDGSADVSHVVDAAITIGKHLQHSALVVVKSTVPVGTCDKVNEVIAEQLKDRESNIAVEVASNPEFLKEGSAVNDFMKPDRLIIGTRSGSAEQTLRELYAPFNRNHQRLIVMDVSSAELSKYAANAMLATKISFMNEIANIAECVGADIEQVRQGIGSDPRIGYHFIYPGCGYGGSCFPKDVRALEATGQEHGYRPQLLRVISEVNERQKQRLAEKILTYYRGDISGRTFALWGLAFKPRTDDMREAPSRVLMEALWANGARVQAFDPQAMDECQRLYGERDNLQLLGTKEAVLKNADALIICTEWKGFWIPDFDQLKSTLKAPVIFDGRNLYDLKDLTDRGFDYLAIGRSSMAREAGTRERNLPPTKAAQTPGKAA